MPTAISQVKSASMTAFRECDGIRGDRYRQSGLILGVWTARAAGESLAVGGSQLEKVKSEEGKGAHPSDEDDRDDRDDESARPAIVSYLLFPLHFFPFAARNALGKEVSDSL